MKIKENRYILTCFYPYTAEYKEYTFITLKSALSAVKMAKKTFDMTYVRCYLRRELVETEMPEWAEEMLEAFHDLERSDES